MGQSKSYASVIPGVDPPNVPPADEWRQNISRFLESQLNRPPDADYSKSLPKGPTEIITKNRPIGNYDTSQLVDDPHMELAIQMMQERYPQLFKGIGSIWVGAPQKPGIGGATRRGWGGGADMTLGHSGGSLDNALDLLRHELSHVAGLDDVTANRTPTAYNVSGASSYLHRDIPLLPAPIAIPPTIKLKK